MENLLGIAKYIENETGIVFKDGNLYQLKSRIDDLVNKKIFKSTEDLALQINNNSLDSNTKNSLLDSATNNETLFFRDPVFFNSIRTYIINHVLPTNPAEIKIWSAASSFGQEAISIAILLDELSREIPSFPKYSIIASDICTKALDKAKNGVYSNFELGRGLSDQRKETYFTAENNGSWKIKKVISDRIQFQHNNLIRSTIKDSFDLILCRNVLIYHHLENKQKIINNISSNIKQHGALLLGVGETLLGIKNDIGTKQIGNVIFYCKKLELKNVA